MISEYYAKQYCCEDISLIENYQAAVEDTTQTWDCHHRAEILPCGIYSQEDLKKFGLFEAQPADMLIFLTVKEHRRLHGYHQSDAAKQKIGEAQRGKHLSDATKEKISKSVSEALRGKPKSEATKEKIGKALRGTRLSEATKQKISETRRGTKWWNNDVKNTMAKECPGPEWKRGKLRRGQKQPHVEGETLK